MFEPKEVAQELHRRLRDAGFNPLDEQVRAITEVVSGYFSEKTAEVLSQVSKVLNKIQSE